MPVSVAREPAATQGLRHAHTTILLHWLTALLVVALWTIGQTIDFAPKGAARVDYRSIHMTLGVILGVVLIVRLVWRLTRGGMLPALQQGVMLVIARATHWLLYVLLLVTVTLGILNVWARGDSVYNLLTVPQWHPGDRPFVHQIGSWHALAANAVLIVAGVHSAAALFHHFVLRDATLRRMLPWQTG
ncbi:MAG TPA: cytochrome b/b6 domain-containing protein [Rhodopila sp.]|nr:cytochrome b/b6 domain-containing protein [Rhodopila sp.]